MAYTYSFYARLERLKSVRIRSIKKLEETGVTITENASLNKIKGTIRCKNQLRYSSEEILNTLKIHHASNHLDAIVELHQVIKRVQRERIPTSIFIVTFESCILPREVTIGWSRCQVREYIPKPRQCFNVTDFATKE